MVPFQKKNKRKEEEAWMVICALSACFSLAIKVESIDFVSTAIGSLTISIQMW
jgi:hypothetical protein